MIVLATNFNQAGLSLGSMEWRKDAVSWILKIRKRNTKAGKTNEAGTAEKRGRKAEYCDAGP